MKSQPQLLAEAMATIRSLSVALDGQMRHGEDANGNPDPVATEALKKAAGTRSRIRQSLRRMNRDPETGKRLSA